MAPDRYDRHDSYDRSGGYTSTRPRMSRQARRAARRRRQILRVCVVLCILLVLLLLAGAVFALIERAPDSAPVPSVEPPAQSLPAPEPEPEPEDPVEPTYTLHTTPATAQVEDSFPSQYVILADLETGEILAQREATTKISPASMTKIMTLLEAVEHIDDLDATFTMTQEMEEYCFANQCTVVGYKVGEQASLRELLYGCIMNSGADACLGLAQAAAGSHEAFVALMNEKLEELGLAETSHFTNCVGLYDPEHYCTVADMALMLKAALENDLCRDVLSARTTSIAPTPEHPEEQYMSNWFIRRVEDQDTGGVNVFCGKTGYVEQAGYCAASCGEASDGRLYLCVTGHSTGTWQSIYDHAALYRTYIGE